MTSTRGTPRLGQSSSALSSLGAVGGPRGTAAGALRVIVEFLTQYDPKAIKQLEGDLQGLSQVEEELGNKQISLADKIAAQRKKIAEGEALAAAKITDRQAKAAFKQSNLLRQTGRPSDLKEARELQRLAFARAGLSDKEARTIGNLVGARTRLKNLLAQELKISQDLVGVDEQRNAVEGRLTQFQQLKAGLPGKLGGLALGAVGGLVGGALIGVGFEAAQSVLDAVAEGLKDLVDPARHARDAIHEVGEEINSIAEGKDLSREAAARQFLEALGIAADDNTIKILAQAAAQDKLSKSIDDQNKLLEIKKHADALSQENIKRETDLLIEQARTRGDLVTKQKLQVAGKGAVLVTDVDRAFYEKQAIAALNQELDNMDAATRRAAAAQAQLEAQMQATAALANVAARALSNAIQSGTEGLLNPLTSQIEALQGADATSARTKAIQDKIEALQNAGSGGSNRNQELANIQQERELILLRQRLRLLGTNIDLEKYSGKFLLEAINAKLKALDKEAQAQDRLNRALDLQYRASQQLRRQEGESVSDFLERRAKENRDVLSEQRQLETEKVKESLQELQEKTQDEVALADLAEREKTAAVKSGTDARIKELQKELKASQKADADALKAKIKALEAKRDALKKSADDAEYYASVAANEEIRQAIRAANTVEKLAQLSGATRGLESAKAFLTALLQSGVLRPEEAKQVKAALDRINTTLSKVGDQFYNVQSHALPGPGGAPKPFASGGFIPLNSGSTPFGSSARFGEEGTEYGMMVLTNRMVNKLRQSQGRDVGTGPITIYESENPLRSAFRTRQAVKQGIEEALH